MTSKLKIAIAALALAVALPHLFFAQTEWVYDDRAVLHDNRVVHDADYATIWTTPYWSGVPSVYQKDNLHRPLFLSLAALLSRHPNWIRFCVLLSHLGAGLLVGVVARSLARGWRAIDETAANWIGWASAAFFLVQPALVEVTAQGIGLMETMPFLIGASALAMARKRPRWALAVAALGPGWKETGYIWLALLAGVFAVRKRYREAALACGVGLAWLGLRAYVYGALFSSQILPFELLNPLVGMSRVDAWLTRIALVGHYLRIVFLPWDLSCDYSRGTMPLPGYPLQIWFLLGAAFLVWLFYRRKDLFRADNVVLWGPLLTVLPVLHLASPVGVIFAERFGYAFAAGCVLCALWAFGPLVWESSRRTKRVFVCCLAFLTFADYGRMALRHRDWMNGETLFSTDLAHYPYNAKLLYNYAVALGQQKRWQAAREQLLRAVQIEPNFPDAHYRLSLVYRELGDPANAKVHHDVAVKLGNTPAEREPADFTEPRKD